MSNRNLLPPQLQDKLGTVLNEVNVAEYKQQQLGKLKRNKNKILPAACLIAFFMLHMISLKLALNPMRRSLRTTDDSAVSVISHQLQALNTSIQANGFQTNDNNGNNNRKRNNNNDGGDDDDETLMVFYNVFAADEKSSGHTMSIVEEQLHRIGAAAGALNSTIQVNYNSIKYLPPNLTEAMLNANVCQPLGLECVHLQHYETASELVTLNSLYEFCGAHPHQRVVYIHSKGSYHNRESNNIWRQNMMDAVFHEDCLQLSPSTSSTTESGTCNVCGLSFYTTWVSFFPGNMWVADCSYVNQLLPPDRVEKKFEEVTRQATMLRSQGLLKLEATKEYRLDFFGLERFAMEHWIGSHPALQPCDMTKHDFGKQTHRHMSTDDNSFQMTVGPHFYGSPVARFNLGKTDPLREYFLLPGLLLKWSILYNGTAPSHDSWVWDWFPKGQQWKDAVNQYGVVGALDRLTHEAVEGDARKLMNKISGNAPPTGVKEDKKRKKGKK